MYVVLKEKTLNSHEGMTVLLRNFDTRTQRDGFVTYAYRNAEQIKEAISHMIEHLKSSVIDDIRRCQVQRRRQRNAGPTL